MNKLTEGYHVDRKKKHITRIRSFVLPVGETMEGREKEKRANATP